MQVLGIVAPGRGEQRMLAGILLRISRRLERYLQDDFMPLLPCLRDPPLQAHAIGREGERHILGQLLDGVLRSGLAQAQPAHHDDDARHAFRNGRDAARINLARQPSIM